MATEPDGAFDGILGSTVTGSGPVETTLLDRTTPSCQATMATVHGTQDATAAITSQAFDHPAGPTQSGDLLPPVPTKLTLEANLGAIGYVLSCAVEGDKNADERFQWSDIAALMHRGVDVTTAFTQVAGGAQTVTFDGDWRFDTQPYRATTVQEETLYPAEPDHSYSVYARNELVIEHSPT